LKHHIINLLLDNHYLKKFKPYYLAIGYLTDKQCSNVKSSIFDINNCLNKVFPTFNRLYKELSSGFQLVNTFSDCISFHTMNYKDNKIKNTLWNLNTILIISNTSIKKNIVTSISHICSGQNILTKTIYYTINVTFIEAELFLIRYEIKLFMFKMPKILLLLLMLYML